MSKPSSPAFLSWEFPYFFLFSYLISHPSCTFTYFVCSSIPPSFFFSVCSPPTFHFPTSSLPMFVLFFSEVERICSWRQNRDAIAGPECVQTKRVVADPANEKKAGGSGFWAQYHVLIVCSHLRKGTAGLRAHGRFLAPSPARAAEEKKRVPCVLTDWFGPDPLP